MMKDLLPICMRVIKRLGNYLFGRSDECIQLLCLMRLCHGTGSAAKYDFNDVEE